MSAAHDVLHTGELLEMILINVDMHTLLLAKRVDRFWLESIKGTLKLQKKLFIVPATTKDIIELKMAEELPPGAARTTTGCHMVVKPGSRPPTSSDFSILNPLFSWRLRYRVAGCSRPSEDFVTAGKPHVTPSWHKMLATQPPQFELWIDPYPGGRELPGSALAGVIFEQSKLLNITFTQSVYEQWLDTNRLRPPPPHPPVRSIEDFWDVVKRERAEDMCQQGEEQDNVET